MIQTIATAFLIFTAYSLGVLSFLSYQGRVKQVMIKAILVSGTIAGALTFFFMHFFIS